MGLPGEKILKNSEVCAELNISDYQRKQLIARGLLDKPIDTGASYPKHTLSQVLRARARIEELSRPKERTGTRRTKELNPKLIAEIRQSNRML